MFEQLKKRFANSSVLVVDDEWVNRETVRECLSPWFTVYSADNGRDGLKQAVLHDPDIILLDAMMEGLSGWDVCHMIQSSSVLSHIPVIFITSSQDAEVQSRCWNAGCVDLITKPFNVIALEHRVKTHVMHKLKTDLLLSLSLRDALTHLSNRRALDEIYPIVMANCRRGKMALTVMMIDIDNFKRYNDTYGHVAGDKTLVAVARTIQTVLHRVTDKLFRYGGEEFVILMPGTESEGAGQMATQLLQSMYSQAIEHKGSDFKCVTFSIGVAVYEPEKIPQALDDALCDVDKLLYKAKNSGKNTFAMLDHFSQ